MIQQEEKVIQKKRKQKHLCGYEFIRWVNVMKNDDEKSLGVFNAISIKEN